MKYIIPMLTCLYGNNTNNACESGTSAGGTNAAAATCDVGDNVDESKICKPGSNDVYLSRRCGEGTSTTYSNVCGQGTVVSYVADSCGPGIGVDSLACSVGGNL